MYFLYTDGLCKSDVFLLELFHRSSPLSYNVEHKLAVLSRLMSISEIFIDVRSEYSYTHSHID